MKKSAAIPKPRGGSPDIGATRALLPAKNLATEIDATFTAGPRTFAGSRLWAFTEGERTLWHSIVREGDANGFAALLLLSLLRDLQTEHDKQIEAGRGRELALELATANFLAATEDVHRYRAKVVNWMRSLTKAQIAEAEQIANAVLQDAKDTELIPADEGTESGN